MSRLYYLNAPPNPFWSFVSDLEGHPFFQGPPPESRERGNPQSSSQNQASENTTSGDTAQAPPDMSEKARGKQATVEDPPEVDPSTVQPENRQKDNPPNTSEPFCGRRRGDRHCRRDRGEWAEAPPFAFGGHPFFARPPPFGRHGSWGRRGPPGPPHPAGPPPGPHHHDHHPHPHPHHQHPRGPPFGRHGPHRRPSPPRHPRPDFDLGEFLNNLGNKLGLDLNRAAEGLGLGTDRFAAGKTSEQVDFEPRTDIFETESLYTIHVSLPGAKKSDIGVDYDGEHSVLRITGVVHRPEFDEEMLKQLVVDGRKRENGVFEKAIRLGTKRDPASVDVAAISAKMVDGVLLVKVPRIAKVHRKRDIPVNADIVTEGRADYEDEYSEKPMLFDADEAASVAETEEAYSSSKKDEINLLDMNEREPEKMQLDTPETTQGKSKEAAEDNEHLPAYTKEADEEEEEEEDWEKFSDHSGEGDYVKINVE